MEHTKIDALSALVLVFIKLICVVAVRGTVYWRDHWCQNGNSEFEFGYLQADFFPLRVQIWADVVPIQYSLRSHVGHTCAITLYTIRKRVNVWSIHFLDVWKRPFDVPSVPSTVQFTTLFDLTLCFGDYWLTNSIRMVANK